MSTITVYKNFILVKIKATGYIQIIISLANEYKYNF